MPLGRRVCPAVGVITKISAVATDRNTIHLLATTVRSSAFFDMDQAAATALRPDATVDDRIVTWRETACGDMIGLLRVHVLNFNSQPRGLIILRLQLQMHLLEWTLVEYMRFVSSSHSSGLTVSSLISHKS